MTTMIKTVTVDDKSGSVFFDEGWDAYGWKTEGFTNGPYDTAEDAEEALLEELG